MHIMRNNMLSNDLNYTVTFSRSFSSSVLVLRIPNLLSRRRSHLMYIVPGIIDSAESCRTKWGSDTCAWKVTGISGDDSRLAKF